MRRLKILYLTEEQLHDIIEDWRTGRSPTSMFLGIPAGWTVDTFCLAPFAVRIQSQSFDIVRDGSAIPAVSADESSWIFAASAELRKQCNRARE